MNLIQNNPYRTVGLLVGATAREQDRQIKRLKQYIEAEQEPQDDFSFPILGNLNRTLENVEEAASKLNLDSDKINAALFWFWNGNPITDEAAFDALKDGDIETAYQIWDKLITETKEDGKRYWKPITEKNYSAFHNCSVINIIRANGNLHNAIASNLYFLESDLVRKFVSAVADETHKTNKKELQLLFLNQLHSAIEANKKISLPKFLEILNKHEFVAKQDFMKGFVQKPIEQIEQKIETVKNKRKASKANAINAGKELYNAVATEISQLKSILGTSDIKLSSISDKVAEELLQCGIDYFKYYRDSNTDPSIASMDLFRKAKSVAIGSVAKQRIQENTKNLQEWINDKPERDKQKKVEEDLKFITSKLERFQNLSDTVSNAKDLVDSCKPKLVNIKNTLGSTDDFYLKISSAVANNALGMLVSAVNAAQETIEVRIGDFSNLRSVVRYALSVSESIGSLDLTFQQRTHYSKNHSTLKSIASQLGVGSYSSYPSGSTSKTNSSSSSSSSTRTTTNSSSPSQSDFEFAPNAWWILGIVFAIIGAIVNGGEGASVGALIGAGLGKLIQIS